MKRTAWFVGGGVAICVSFLLVLLGVVPGVAGVLLLGIVTAAVFAACFAWDTKNLRTATARTEELSAQLVRKEIEIGRLATVDELTGLYTRREFDEMIRLEWERRRRHGRDFSLLLLEIDDIVELGENVGSLNKGFLIAEVSAIFKHILRANDLGCRYTNDSLAMLLPETNGIQARVLAERIRITVSKHAFLEAVDRQQSMNISVSQGIAVADSTMTSHTDLMKVAEGALVKARADGFDQVRVIEPNPAADQPAA